MLSLTNSQAAYSPQVTAGMLNKTYIKLNKGVRVKREYKVYDANRLIGSIGGSLGLFIGFSFLDLALALVKRIRDVIGRF